MKRKYHQGWKQTTKLPYWTEDYPEENLTDLNESGKWILLVLFAALALGLFFR